MGRALCRCEQTMYCIYRRNTTINVHHLSLLMTNRNVLKLILQICKDLAQSKSFRTCSHCLKFGYETMLYAISMAYCKTAVTPLLSHWIYCSLILIHRHVLLYSRDHTQITKTVGSISIRHRFDAKVWDRCIIDVDPMFFAIWVEWWSCHVRKQDIICSWYAIFLT